MKRSAMSPGTKQMKRSPMKRSVKLPGTVPSFSGGKPEVARTRMKSTQRAVTAAEHELWDRLANEVGCIACRKDGRFNIYVSIHHIDGRTKPGCHKLVLPLCGPHHQQDDTDYLKRIAVHPNIGRFTRKYGAQRDLLAECLEILAKKGITP